MKKPAVVRGFCLLLILALTSPFAPAAWAASALGQIVAQQPAAVNDVPVRDHATLFSGDRLTTGVEGWARVQLPENNQLHLHAESVARVERRGERLAVLLDQGQVTMRTHGQNGLHVHSNALEIASQTTDDTVWDVTRLSDKRTRVAVHRGTLEVRGLNQVIELTAGQSVEVQTEFGPNFDPEARRRMQA
ncbi:MAG: FecR domain-containing protein, partial [Terriglobia bacterium]